jgi:cytochrome c oxidase subunit IV
MTEASETASDAPQQGVERLYLVAWLVLIAITATEIGLVLAFHGSPAVRATALILLALMKATLIGAYYMNLRFERIALVYIAILPLLLLALMLFAVAPDAGGILRRP